MLHISVAPGSRRSWLGNVIADRSTATVRRREAQPTKLTRKTGTVIKYGRNPVVVQDKP
ncbi:MAG: hypothetical protein ACKV22_13500 [Bryobacteraceae bacterium]